MDKEKLFETFTIRDYVEICKEMKYLKFNAYSRKLFSGAPVCARLELVLAKTSLETHSICGRACQI